MKEVVFEKEHGKPYDFYRSFVSLFGQRFTGRGILTEFNYEEWHKRRLILNTAFHRKYESLILGRDPGGGHSHWKGVWGCAAVMTPIFQDSRRSLARQYTVNAPLLCPLFSIFRKFLHFQPCFGQNFSSLDPNFSKFSFPRPPLFFRKIRSLDLHFETRVAHTHKKKKKKKLSAPPGAGSTQLFLGWVT